MHTFTHSGMTRRLACGLLIAVVAAAVLPLVAQAGAEPGEDGADPGAGGYYDASPLGGWMTERAGDRVHDFAQIGNTVYVAGTFSGVRPTRTGPVTWQGNLAAFDATTGAFVPGFAPDINGTVYSLAVSEDGTRLYAGGTFTTVNGGDHRRLASLDPTTGTPVAAFDADVSGGSVRSIVARGNRLYVGGNYSTIKGVARARLARVNDLTGAVDPGWAPNAAGGSVLTLELPTVGSRLYVGGRFTSINGVARTAELAAVSTTDGAVLPTFTGQPGREVYDLVAADDGRLYVAEGGPLGRAEAYDSAGSLLARWDTNGDVEAVEIVGDRVFFGGHDFGPEEADHVAVVDPDDLSVFDVEAVDTPTTGGDGVWAFHATADQLWIGGQHTGPSFGFGRYAAEAAPPPREDLVSAGSGWRFLDNGSDQGTAWRQTAFNDSTWAVGSAQLGFGDDDESTELDSGHVTYWFRRSFPVVSAAALSDTRLSLLMDDGAVAYVNGTEVARHNMPAGPVTAATRASTTVFGPAESTYTTFDVPAELLVDGTNTVAVEVHQVTPGSSDVSFDGRLTSVGVTPDTQAPTVPTGLQASTPTDTSFTLSWNASVDSGGVSVYEIFRDGASVGTTPTTSFAVSGLSPSTSYQLQVEAVDGSGNRSARSAALSVTTTAAPPVPTEVIVRGSNWRYLDDGSDQGSAWRAPGFDAGGWRVGPAELGLGDGDEATVVAGGPVTYWFRRSFSVASAAAISALDLELLADDGAVVYLNGVEVVRDNMPAGAIGRATNATDYRFGADEARFNDFSLSRSALVDGVNVLAVEVHQALGSTDLSFDASLEATGGAADTTAPSVPTGLVASGVTDTSIDLGWTASSDDVGVDHYDVFVNGSPAGTSLGATRTLTGLSASTSYQLQVEAVDGSGNRSARSAALPVTTDAPPAGGPATFIDRGAVWSYLDTGVDPGPGWTAPGFNASSWRTGPGELGFADGDEATVMTAGHITYWFRRTFTAPVVANVRDLSISLLADDGAIVYVNGVEVVRDNMPAGAIGPTTLASTYRFGSAETAYRTFPIPTTALVNGVNTIAVEVHQADLGSADFGFDLSLAGFQ